MGCEALGSVGFLCHLPEWELAAMDEWAEDQEMAEDFADEWDEWLDIGGEG